jgi:hypothetical protein
MRKYLLLYFVLVMFCSQIILSGCTSTTALSLGKTDQGTLLPSNFNSPEEYLDALGLKVEKQLPDEKSVMPTPGPRLALLEVFAEDIKVNIKNFSGKNLVLKNYLLKDHPLQQQLGEKTEIIASLWLVDEKIIGGNIQAKAQDSTTYLNEGYSLRGRSLKEITNMDFNAWYSNWKDKTYGAHT